MTRSLAGAAQADAAPDIPSPAFEALFASGLSDPSDIRERLDALRAMPRPRAYVTIGPEDGPADAAGAARVADGLCGIFSMRTRPEVRRRGLAALTLTRLIGFGARAGARLAYLQVEADNAPALALYRKFGFRRRYAYRYWSRA